MGVSLDNNSFVYTHFINIPLTTKIFRLKGTLSCIHKSDLEMALRRTNSKLVELFLPDNKKANSTAPTSDTAFSEEDFTSDQEETQEYNENHTENRCRVCYRMLKRDSNDKDLCADENNVLLYYIEVIAGVRVGGTEGVDLFVNHNGSCFGLMFPPPPGIF